MTLKPEALHMFNISAQFINALDIKMLISCLQQGVYVPSSNYILHVHRLNTYKSSYEYLPRAFKYSISEDTFTSMLFVWDEFYMYTTDTITIEINYCEYILKRYPTAKKTLKLYNKLKVDHPEYFI